jgi:two-component system, NarL family, invasion response regulator UvrY
METLSGRIIIADDHAIVRTGLQLILDGQDGLSVVDEARNGQELLNKLWANENEYDLVVLDISMPGKDAMDVLKEIKATWNLLPVVIFSMNPDEVYAIRMITNGASAYINKETKSEQIIDILKTVLGGKKYISPTQAEMLSEIMATPKKLNKLPHEILTDREFQVFVMLANGIRKSEIAQKLYISKNTLSNHKNNILKKMNMSMDSELTRYAIQNGIIQ